MLKVFIEKHNNGYKVGFKGKEERSSAVYQTKEDLDITFSGSHTFANLEKDHIIEMLHSILDYFGESNKYNITSINNEH